MSVKTIKLDSIKDKLNKKKTDGISWVELFFTANIYIVGFSFDFSEIDLWWILTKRARLIIDDEVGIKIKNKIYFYCSSIGNAKRGLFESLGVEIFIIPNTGNYENNYRDMIYDNRTQIAST